MTPALLYLTIAITLIIIELLIMQLSSLWFLLFGFGALITSAICWLFPELSLISATVCFGLTTVLVFFFCYPLLKKWQNKPSPLSGNDAIGQTVIVVTDITESVPGKVTWSGSEWSAELVKGEAALNAGERAKIVKLEGIRLIVAR